jgi:hypothetical protein
VVAYLWEQRLLIIVAFAAEAEAGRHVEMFSTDVMATGQFNDGL